MMMNIRPTVPDDVAALQLVLDGTQLFPSEMLPDMIRGHFSGQTPDEIWLTCEIKEMPVGFCYAVPEKLTEGTYNMLAIAVSPAVQRTGTGSALVAALEEMLRNQGHRILVADTSGTDEFRNTRSFYQKAGYTQEARVRDFWSAGNDKIVYWKAL